MTNNWLAVASIAATLITALASIFGGVCVLLAAKKTQPTQIPETNQPHNDAKRTGRVRGILLVISSPYIWMSANVASLLWFTLSPSIPLIRLTVAIIALNCASLAFQCVCLILQSVLSVMSRHVEITNSLFVFVKGLTDSVLLLGKISVAPKEERSLIQKSLDNLKKLFP